MLSHGDPAVAEVVRGAGCGCGCGCGRTGLPGRDFGDGTTTVSVEAAGEGSVELALAGGQVLARLDIPGTTGPYDYTTVTGPAAHVTEVHDLHITLRGRVRLARVGFSG